MSMTVENAISILRHMKNLIYVRVIEEEALQIGMDAIEEVEQYRAIGTVSELRELKEKATAKKVVDKLMYIECPNCGDVGIEDCGYCPCCGQYLDWSEGKE